MMSPGKLAMSVSRPSPVEISNEIQLQQAIDLSEKKFVLLDVHEDWCGPTKAILPYYNQLWLDVDEAGKRIFLASVCITNIELKNKLKALVSNIDFDTQGCRPLFLVARNGKIAAHIDGVNPPSVDFYLKLYLPDLSQLNEENRF